MIFEINHIYQGDALTVLKTIPDESVDCCVTSPPYYGLRDYGVSGQIGLESTPEQYIEKLTEVFSEVKRVLKPHGTAWINIGDSYAGSGRGKGDVNKKGRQPKVSHIGDKFDKPQNIEGYKNKDLIGVPYMLAFALRADGWYLRQAIIWHKPNPMPESVKDRCTKSYEHILLLSKSPKYFFDHNAIKEKAKYDGRKDTTYKGSAKYAKNGVTGLSPQSFSARGHERWQRNENGEFMRNKRDVWSVCTKPEREAHFACFPQELIVDCIKAGCPVDGVVLDPFIGSGTTAVVAQKLGRNYLGIELNPLYIEIAKRKIARSGN